VPRDFYSPIPDLERLPEDIWDRRTALRGVAFDPSQQLEWAELELAPFIGELDGDDRRDGFYFENTLYEHGDAELTYAMVRRFRPGRIIELGSGFSTLVLARASSANRAAGAPCRLVVNDPFESRVARPHTQGVESVLRRPAQEIPVAEFEALEANDVLFVDTSHVVKLGGDVNYVILEVLPALRPGVLVHFHDIWLPDEYHRALTEAHGTHWSEQYLLQAFLIGNSEFEILFATHAVSVAYHQRFQALVPGYDGSTFPTSFWIRRAQC
jgi:predicted O-methyltransferase YrrM